MSLERFSKRGARRRWMTMVAIVASVALAGCVSEPNDPVAPPPDEDRPLVSRLEADAIFAPGPASKRYAVYDLRDGGKASGAESRDVTAEAADGTWKVTTVLSEDNGDERAPQVTTLRREPDGSIVTTTVKRPRQTDDPDAKPMLYVYDPPLVMTPPVLEPGETFEQTVEMTEREHDEPDEVRGTGETKRTVRLATRSELDEAFGPGVATTGFVAEMKTKFGPAIDTRRSVHSVDPTGQRGITGETIRRELKVAIMTLKKENRRYELSSEEHAEN